MVCKSAKLPLKLHHHNYSSAEFVVSTMLANSYETKVVGGSVPGSFSLQVKVSVLDTH